MRKSIYLLFAISLVVGVGGCEGNDVPIIEQLTVPQIVEPGSRVAFEVVAHDDNGDALTYTWTVDGTPLDATTSAVEWTAPEVEGTVTVEVHVSDGEPPPTTERKVLTVSKTSIEMPEVVPVEVPEVVPPVDVSKHSVPLDQVYFDTFQFPNRAVPLSEASPELIERLLDAIPPINNPRYETATEAASLDDQEVVIGYAAGDGAWAYLVTTLN